MLIAKLYLLHLCMLNHSNVLKFYEYYQIRRVSQSPDRIEFSILHGQYPSFAFIFYLILALKRKQYTRNEAEPKICLDTNYSRLCLGHMRFEIH